MGLPPRLPLPITLPPCFQSRGVSVPLPGDRERVILTSEELTHVLKSVQALHVRIQQESSLTLSNTDEKEKDDTRG